MEDLLDQWRRRVEMEKARRTLRELPKDPDRDFEDGGVPEWF